MLVPKHSDQALTCGFLKILNLLFYPLISISFISGLNYRVGFNLLSRLVQSKRRKLLVADLLIDSLVNKRAWSNLGLVGHVVVANDIDVLEIFIEDMFDFDSACHISLQLLDRTS